jgi:hypothetical protein
VALAPARDYRESFTLHAQTLNFGRGIPRFGSQRLHRAFGLTIGFLQTLNLSDLPMQYLGAIGKRRPSPGQIGEVLFSRQRGLIPSTLAFGCGNFAVSFAQTLDQVFDLGQERLQTGFDCLKLQQPLLCYTLFGFQRFKAG